MPIERRRIQTTTGLEKLRSETDISVRCTPENHMTGGWSLRNPIGLTTSGHARVQLGIKANAPTFILLLWCAPGFEQRRVGSARRVDDDSDR